MTTSYVSSTNAPLSTPAGPRGTCQVYHGQVCDPWLNYTMLEYRWSPRFIDNRFGLNGTELVIVEFIYAINRIDGQEKCKNILKAILCLYVLPPCDANSVRYHYCREDCEAVFQKCYAAMREMLGAAKYILEKLGIEFAHIGVPDCTKLNYSASYEATNSTCLHWGLFDFSTAETVTHSPPKSHSATVAGAVGGVVALVIVAVVISCICKRRKKKLSKGFAGVTFTAVSMRDRIRAEALRALDESKVMSLFNPDDIKQVPLTSIEYVRDLGSGNFGLVFLGRVYGLIEGKPEAELMVAVKTLKEGSSTETKEDFFKEVALMSLLHHTNIVELLAVSTEEEPYGMIFEFMELGDLNQYLRKAGPFFEGDEKERVTLTQADLISMSLQCAAGMEHLQTLRFVHRDVATRNCLVGTGLIVKISDFGMSRDIYASDYYKVEGQAVLPIRWMPPEALLLGKFTLESDIYSFGVLLWEIYTLALQPYYGYTNEEVVEFIKKGVHLGQPEDCPDHVYQIMKNCWHKEASQRPNFTLIIAQLKQEDTTHYDSLDSPGVSDKQPLYQNSSASSEDLKEELPVIKQTTRKNSQQALSASQSGVPPPSAYINVACNPGFHSDD
ncbi:Muscle, skeletal receptor tyrosine protein kinase [Stylophora pistillata]|uniref:Muscle, skeletal receptor tyrosine protein kinase n=2 Tax=Stylophora pistillata TaxID=50429 RepID=A0A2B4S0D8_STYPI|nr:Muscle, skeletal receptor tyrosine protein kinase [Stylophora pistillata]